MSPSMEKNIDLKERKKNMSTCSLPNDSRSLFPFVRVSKEGFLCPFQKKEAVVSNGTKANPYVTLIEQLLVHDPTQHQNRTNYTGHLQSACILCRIIDAEAKECGAQPNAPVIQVVLFIEKKQGSSP